MPKIDIAELDRELKQGKIRFLYVITGSERYLSHGALRRIQETLREKGGEFGEKSFSGKETKAEDLINSLRTVPLLGGRPTIIIKDAEGLSKNVLEVLTDYLEKPVESSTLVLVAEKLDGRTRFMSLAAKIGAVIECKPLYMDKVPFWINMETRRLGKQISQEAARFLADMIGNDLGQLANAIERICLYVGERKIVEIKDVEDAVAETHQRDVFELTDAVGSKKLVKAMSLLHNILENGESPILVLNMLARHFRILSKAKEIAGRVTDNSEVARYLGVHPYFAKNYLSQSRNFSGKELRAGFRTLCRCDRELKSSRVAKERIIEKALFSLVGKAS